MEAMGVMKRKTAKEILAESLKEIAASKSIDKITIKDITLNCGYSSATFYRQFRDKQDLIEWDYINQIKDIVSMVDGKKDSWQNSLRYAAVYFEENKEYLSNLFMNTSGMDSFIKNMREINYAQLKNIVLGQIKSNNIEKKLDASMRIYVLGTVQFACEWILGKYDITVDELAEVFNMALPEELKKMVSK